jgi:hypothetical protein
VRVPVASEGETRDEALGNAKEAIEASLEVKAEQLKQRTRGEKVVMIFEAASPRGVKLSEPSERSASRSVGRTSQLDSEV